MGLISDTIFNPMGSLWTEWPEELHVVTRNRYYCLALFFCSYAYDMHTVFINPSNLATSISPHTSARRGVGGKTTRRRHQRRPDCCCRHALQNTCITHPPWTGKNNCTLNATVLIHGKQLTIFRESDLEELFQYLTSWGGILQIPTPNLTNNIPCERDLMRRCFLKSSIRGK
jgi:hypothetical protein